MIFSDKKFSFVTDPFYHYDPTRPKDYNAVTMNLHDPYA